MANINLDPPRGGREDAKAPEAKSPDGKAAEDKESPAAGKGGGLKTWLPLIVAVVTMPALAFVTTKFILLPQFKKAMTPGSAAAAAPEAAPEAAASEKSGEKPTAGKPKETATFNKMLVNVAGTMGTRYLMTSLTLVGTEANFKEKIADNKDQLLDLATSTLSTKTISDLEKPGARNEIRAELLTVFNNAMGKPMVQEIYITELAIQ